MHKSANEQFDVALDEMSNRTNLVHEFRHLNFCQTFSPRKTTDDLENVSSLEKTFWASLLSFGE